jgi:hypothetical protein
MNQEILPSLPGFKIFILKSKIGIYGQAPVARTCNPSYSGGRDQEDHGSKSQPSK